MFLYFYMIIPIKYECPQRSDIRNIFIYSKFIMVAFVTVFFFPGTL